MMYDAITLQSAFYVVGIVFMGLMLFVALVLLTTVLMIWAKIAAIHRRIENNLEMVRSLSRKGKTLLTVFKHTFNRKNPPPSYRA